MALAKTLTLRGKANWCKVFEQNRDREGFNGSYTTCDGAYTLDLILEPDQYQALKESGSMKTGTLTEDGLRVKFVRKHKGPFAAASGAPKIVNDVDQPWDLDTMGTLGNGSELEITVSVYPIKAYGTVGTRLETIKVLDHVVYEAPVEAPTVPVGELTV